MRYGRGRAGILWMLAVATLLSFVLGCDAFVPSPERQALPSSTSTAAPSLGLADKIVVGVHVGEEAVGPLGGSALIDLPLFPMLAHGRPWDRTVRRFVYSGIYRYNADAEPELDLATEPCTWTEDKLDITCKLRRASFHDGTPLTADDVAFTFQLRASEACEAQVQEYCVPLLESAVARDDHTVVFHLEEPDATFLTIALPDVLIESRRRIEASYAVFKAGSRAAEPAGLAALEVRISESLAGDSPDCASLVTDAETTVRRLGLEPWSRDEFALGSDDVFDPCAYAEYLARVLGDAADSLTRDDIDAIAAAYRILDFQTDPVGSGPWMVRSVTPGKRMVLEAFDAFHRGRPATSHLEVRLLRTKADAVEAVRTGAVDWLLQPFVVQAPFFLGDALKGANGLTLATYDEYSWFAVHYNLRPGRLFAEANLREAMELCIDKQETVWAATRGQYLPIQSPVLPSHWAYEPELTVPVRDVEAAKELIEEKGWKVGSDDFYAKDGRRLSADVLVRDERPDRLRFLQLLADQLKDCGIEIVPRPSDGDPFRAAFEWPLHLPGRDQPWDLLFNGYVYAGTPDPLGDYESFHSDEITRPAKRNGKNMTGYSNVRVDRLLDLARSTYEMADRARLFREYQRILAEDRPMLFAWAPRFVVARSNRLASTSGPLSASSAIWWWELETLVLGLPAG
jgi:ABC-type transport system substrate-binding protein